MVNNLRPVSRYSHAITMVNSKLLIFGCHLTMSVKCALDLMSESYSKYGPRDETQKPIPRAYHVFVDSVVLVARRYFVIRHSNTIID